MGWHRGLSSNKLEELIRKLGTGEVFELDIQQVVGEISHIQSELNKIPPIVLARRKSKIGRYKKDLIGWNAEVAILRVSDDFLSSKFIHKNLLPQRSPLIVLESLLTFLIFSIKGKPQ